MQRSRFMFLSILFIAVFILSGCSKDDTPKVLRIGTNPEFPPFEYIDDKGAVDGFDVALTKEIGKALNKEVVINSMEFKSLIDALQQNQIDMIAAAMSVNEKREESVDFSDTYYTAKIVIVVNKDNDTIKTGDDLVGKKAAVQKDTTGDSILTDEYQNVEVLRLKKGIDAIMALNNGTCDAVAIDYNPAKEFVSKNPGLKILEEPLAEEEYALAVRKGDKKTLDAVNKALAEMKASGLYDELVSKYINE